MNALPVRITAMAWYRAEDYDAILRIKADRHKLPRTFVEWRMKAESGEKKLRRDGHTVLRAYIDPETFPDWCRARGLHVDAQARMHFAAIAAKEQAGGTH